ncbi:hypothetical protein MHLP_01090 [Candidatus Mycoplasma haematolamae str. Purdue]|uniref:Uncharacterized protein n=1 Tax=Mycoplasma haematolamae (strain Purdue) TaxID=1212765 RepID=I7BIZ4_MYCHA|nr:hypothetical protein [Candidatus Mycoplasma haematolamae]AFO51798.1 hypothetical protein MHLP_01090 [Candidatus Mycoplasma haematolamae str. Purdue]
MIFKELAIGVLGLGAVGGTVTTVTLSNSSTDGSVSTQKRVVQDPEYFGKPINYKMTVNKGIGGEQNQYLKCSGLANHFAFFRVQEEANSKKFSLICQTQEAKDEEMKLTTEFDDHTKLSVTCVKAPDTENTKTFECVVEGNGLSLRLTEIAQGRIFLNRK